jgi:tetratricopeptide (TPR) repeat protein
MKTTQLRIAALFALVFGTILSCSTPQEEAPAPAQERVEELAPVNKGRSALDSLNALIVDNPNNLDVLESRARLYLGARNLAYAQADINAVLAADSNRVGALEILGDLGFASNKTRESRDAWQKCMRLDPEYVPCRLKMAQLYHVVTEFEKSAELVDIVLNLEPENPEAHFLKGLLMRDALGDTARALQWFQKAIDIAPDYVEAIDMCGVLYSAQGNPLALAYFNRLIELDPENKLSFYNRGMFFLGQQNWNGALEDFTTCTKLDPADLESFFNLGYIHLQLQLPREAIGYFNQALSIQPINHRALYGRGYSYELLGDMPNAENDYREALSYNPDHEGSRQGVMRIQRAKAQAGVN